jgi:RNA polymerase sigma factor (sigma-70 family)
MYLSNSCLAEAYCQDAYAAANHDVIAEAFCRAIKTYDPQKGDFRTWVGIQRSGVVREDQRFRQRVGYLEETCAANEEQCGEIVQRDQSSDFIFARPDHPSDSFLISPAAIFNASFRKEQKKIIKDLLSSVGKRSRMIIIKRFYERKQMHVIAKELRITDSTVDRDEKKTLRFFRETLAKKNVVLDDVVL